MLHKKKLLIPLLTLVLAGALIVFYFIKNKSSKEIVVIYPFKTCLFPPEFPAPLFQWADKNPSVQEWQVEMYTADNSFKILSKTLVPFWRPKKLKWDSIKIKSNFDKIYFRVSRVIPEGSKIKKAVTSFYFTISRDEVGAPILYREIPLPFVYAEKYPEYMSYRLVNPGSDSAPQYAMKNFIVCGNCHSFSQDGKKVGLDFDAALRDKGGYFITEVKDSMVFDTSNYLSWSKLQPHKTFGLFSKISPDGRYVVTTIKDRVIHYGFPFDPNNIAFSQLFFPVNGVLAIYDTKTRKLKELPGANLPEYVQSNAAWTPDGKNIVFVRSKSIPYETDSNEYRLADQAVVNEFIERKRDFKFDLCIVPFNDGNGGTAKLIKGASDNGMSNYFPAVSPDGKWIVFCKSDNYMMLQADSRLFIVPVEGGKARKLECNMYLMNSWHAWSPNSKWMVFSSKGLSKYTDLFLTHIDEKGRASIPVLIENTHIPGHAANYPEFLNVKPDFKLNMNYKYVNIDHISRALFLGDTASAEALYKQFLAQKQYSLPDEYNFLGQYNLDKGRYSEAAKYFRMSLAKDPKNNKALTKLHSIKNMKHP